MWSDGLKIDIWEAWGGIYIEELCFFVRKSICSLWICRRNTPSSGCVRKITKTIRKMDIITLKVYWVEFEFTVKKFHKDLIQKLWQHSPKAIYMNRVPQKPGVVFLNFLPTPTDKKPNWHYQGYVDLNWYTSMSALCAVLLKWAFTMHNTVTGCMGRSWIWTD